MSTVEYFKNLAIQLYYTVFKIFQFSFISYSSMLEFTWKKLVFSYPASHTLQQSFKMGDTWLTTFIRGNRLYDFRLHCCFKINEILVRDVHEGVFY